MTGPSAWMGVPPVGGGDTFPAWRQAMTNVDQWYTISSTANMAGVTVGDAAQVNAWNGFAAGPHHWYAAWTGGHGCYFNAVYALDLSADSPQWTELHAPSALADRNNNEYFADGRPCSRHSYFDLVYVAQTNRVMAFAKEAYDGGSAPYSPDVDGFDLLTNTDDAQGTYPDVPITTGVSPVYSSAIDKRTGNVYKAGAGGFARWNRALNTWTTITPQNQPSGFNLEWGFKNSLIDETRDRWVSLNGPRVNYLSIAAGTLHNAYHANATGEWSCTSSTSATINQTNADMVFTLDDSVTRELFKVDHILRFYSQANRSNYMGAVVTAYSPPSITVNPGISKSRLGESVPSNHGSVGPWSDWFICALTDDYAPMVHDLDNDRYLIGKNNMLYAMDPDTFEVTKICAMTIPWWSSGTVTDPLLPGSGTHRFSYFQELGGVAYLPAYSANIEFLPTR